MIADEALIKQYVDETWENFGLDSPNVLIGYYGNINALDKNNFLVTSEDDGSIIYVVKFTSKQSETNPISVFTICKSKVQIDEGKYYIPDENLQFLRVVSCRIWDTGVVSTDQKEDQISAENDYQTKRLTIATYMLEMLLPIMFGN